MPASLFDAYVSGGADEFFPNSFLRSEDRLRALARVRPIAPEVLRQLEAQNARFGASSAREAHLRALGEGAAAVVTGQQVGLFLGPLFTVYKAATAIRCARALSEEGGRPVVPVFWLQTEDHDIAEIAHCTSARAQAEPLALALPVDTHNRIAIEHLKLPEAIASCLTTLERELGELPHARSHLSRLAKYYRAGAGWADAFAGVLAELFEPEGLLVIDPRDAVFATAASALHRDALERCDALGALLVERRDALERAGYEAVVHVRPDSPLAFFHPEGPAGSRFRLVQTDDGLQEIGGARSHQQHTVLEAFEREPLCLSTSALLRPLLQDTLLPTVAYVGGPAEVAYYAQLVPLYGAFDRELPLVVPRARFRVVEPAAARLLERYALAPDAVAASEPVLLAQLAGAGAGDAVAPAAFERALAEQFGAALAAALATLTVPMAPMQSAIDKTRAKLELTTRKLAQRYTRVLAERDEQRVRDVRRLRSMLQPTGVPQERCFGLAYFAARYGERAFLERVLEAIGPFEATRKELYL